MQQTKENVGANVYNRGFNSAFLMQGGDGVELFSTAHINGPSDPTTFSNELATPAALISALLSTRKEAKPFGYTVKRSFDSSDILFSKALPLILTVIDPTGTRL